MLGIMVIYVSKMATWINGLTKKTKLRAYFLGCIVTMNSIAWVCILFQHTCDWRHGAIAKHSWVCDYDKLVYSVYRGKLLTPANFRRHENLPVIVYISNSILWMGYYSRYQKILETEWSWNCDKNILLFGATATGHVSYRDVMFK